MPNIVDVDQSGKIGSKTATVLALSNDTDRTMLIPARLKREGVETLRLQGRKGNMFYLQLFVVAVFLLLKDHIDDVVRVVIDVKYPTKDTVIKEMLLNLFHRAGKRVPADVITFGHIGKGSRVQQRALATFRGERQAGQVLTAEDIMRQLGK